jgi:glycosyltransferase involved in cell wall biosynthesis
MPDLPAPWVSAASPSSHSESIVDTTVECSVVIPAFNEESTLAAIVDAVRPVLEGADARYEIIVVDDGASDGTWRVISTLAGNDARIQGVRFTRNFGKEAAIRAGLGASTGRAVVVMDADAQHPPAVLAQMLALWRTGDVDVVEGVKVDRGRESALRRGMAGMFYRLWSGLAGYRLDGASDFKLLGRRVVDRYLELPESHLFFRGLTAWLGFRTVQVPFDVAPRVGGRSGWSLRALARQARVALTSFTSAPLHLVTAIGIAFLVFAVALGAQTVWHWARGTAVEGFTTVILLLLVTGSALLIGLGVIGEYIARIYDEVKRRPRFVVAERTPTASGSAVRSRVSASGDGG